MAFHEDTSQKNAAQITQRKEHDDHATCGDTCGMFTSTPLCQLPYVLQPKIKLEVAMKTHVWQGTGIREEWKVLHGHQMLHQHGLHHAWSTAKPVKEQA